MIRLNNEQLSSGVFFCFGVVVTILSVRYGLGSFSTPDTGFMPFLSGLAICFFSFIGLVHGTLQRKQGMHWKPIMKGLMWEKSLFVMGALIAYALLINKLGFIVCTLLFLGFLFRVVKPISWPFTIVYSILISFISYIIFEIWLKSQLPRGPWGF
jgi:hypothetical protein